MDGHFRTLAIGAAIECGDGMHLRQRMIKLRWMGFEAEADAIADEIARRRCEPPPRLPFAAPSTD
jgi:hypothetical protein